MFLQIISHINLKNIINRFIYINNLQFGAWASWVCWVGLSVFSTLKLCRYHQQENIRSSMARERARLASDTTRLVR